MLPSVQLNSQQTEAVHYGLPEQSESGPLLIIAGAGTGKTNTLAHKTAQLILSGVPPEKILLVTFARRAAAELASRANRIVEQTLAMQKKSKLAAKIEWMGTFHSISARLLREFAPAIGLESDFTVLDRNDSADMLDVLRHELGFSKTHRRFPKKKTCLDIYSRCVNSQQPIEEIVKQHFPHCSDWPEQLKQLFSAYAKTKAEQLSLDYDDLLLYAYHMAEVPEISKQVRERFDYVLVDEYQDTNQLQAGLLTRLFPDGRGLTVVGDDAQSIYGFRAASVDNILNFPQQFEPPAKVIALQHNYRSHQKILDLSNTLLEESAEGYKVKLNSDKPLGVKPKLVTVEDDAKQAEYIVEQVLAARESGVELKRQAVLFRSSYHSDRLELELTRRNIPYVKHGGLKFLEAAHVKDLLCLLRWADNPKHKISGFRLLKLLPGVGPKIAEKALNHLASHQFRLSSLGDVLMPEAARECYSQVLHSVLAINAGSLPWQQQLEQAAKAYQGLLEHNYEDHFARWGDVEQLVQISQQYPNRERFLTELTLDPPQSSGDLCDSALIDDDFLILSTVHSAKGQEWQNVFLLNVADGNFPNEYAVRDSRAMEEERRLLYVAMTRAKDQLHLMQPLKYWVPEQQSWGDKHVYGAKSRFLSERVSQMLETCHYPKVSPDQEERQAGLAAITDIRKTILSQWDS
ncbi:ATP-dependent helicase [Paraferrimonas sedimenticola]|uniref:DNA 3'-5' helicase n=1 Tax=Paraferrimonas sedimenticola TaxID=375674 RepID=A0AA37VYH7_9GAMM|nr:ATP-dependent helicase [Paraferrimonas sedimenticola]GLP95500.1 DNA helicase [Paraferrimonas sedimenticola]